MFLSSPEQEGLLDRDTSNRRNTQAWQKQYCQVSMFKKKRESRNEPSIWERRGQIMKKAELGSLVK